MKSLSCLLPMLMVALMVGPASSTAGGHQGKLPLYATDKSDERIASYSAETQLLFGADLVKGASVPRDLQLAQRYFEAAYVTVPKNAARTAALRFIEVPGGEKYAVIWLERSASLGEKFSYLLLGHIYENGREVERSYAKARKYYELADDPIADSALSRLYANGLGGDKDLGKAMYYDQRSQQVRRKQN